MRIIGGRARGTKLRSLQVQALRPMLDRVKESLFNIIRAELPGAKVLDLFCGGGSLGIEALSRGAATCTFVESDRRLCRLTVANVRRCRFEDRATVLSADFFSLPARAAPAQKTPADLVFVDPPYRVVDRPSGCKELFATLEALSALWMGPGALIVLHHRPLRVTEWPTTLFDQHDARVYGQSQLTFFSAKPDAGHHE